MTISGLVSDGTLRVASRPPRNWQDAAHAPLTVPLIAEDYPAKTAVMWNSAYEAFDLPDRNSMMLGRPEDVARILATFRSDPAYVGGGAGIGFKEVAIPHLDSTTPLANAMGAINIIKKMPDGTLVGDNTDGRGYAESLKEALATKGRELKSAHVLVLGAGGTGRAIAFALAEAGATLTILNRTSSKAQELADAVNAYVKRPAAEGGGREGIEAVMPSVDAVVSTVDDAHSPLDEYSPLGGMAVPVTPTSIAQNRAQTMQLLSSAKPGVVISDIRIRSKMTPMLAMANDRGLPTLDGIPMVINQGVEAFWWLYGQKLESQGRTKAALATLMWEAARQ